MTAGRNARRAVRSLAIAVLAAMTLVGCQAVPDSGPVRTGLSDFEQSDRQVLFNPNGPLPGASADDVVRGFVNAASSSSDDYAIAREFLTSDYASQWDPYAGVLIDDGTRPYREPDEGVGLLSLSAVASVDSHGVMTPAAPGPTTEVRFELEKQGGEWRISSAPTGVILEQPTFEAAWTVQPVYFLDQRGRLVPEYRWFLDRPTLPSQIVGELLDGPIEAYRNTLHTGFPAGTRLATSSVPVADGTADVSLSSEIAEAGSGTLESIERQLSASFESVSSVSNIELSGGDADIERITVGRPDETSSFTENQLIAVLRDGEFGSLTAGSLDGLGKLGRAIVGTRPDAVTLAPGLEGAAVRNGDGISWVEGSDVVPLDTRSRQLEPSVDSYGYVWAYSAERGGGLAVHQPDGATSPVEASWLSGYEPTAIRVSPSGARVAVLVGSGEGSLVLVAPVVRDEEGRPTGLGDEAVEELWASGKPLDLDWIDEQSFAALTRVGEGGKVTIGGPGALAVEAGSVPGGTKISGSGSSLRVLDDRGNLFAQQGSPWQRQERERGIDILAKRG